MVKPRSRQAPAIPVAADKRIDALADKLADKPYGTEGQGRADETVTISISLPSSLRDRLDDIAMQRKRAKAANRSVSSIIREALENHLDS